MTVPADKGNQPTYQVIFRACDQVNAVNHAPRPYGLDKHTLIKVCFLSLVASLRNVPHKLTVLGDRLSEPLLQFFGQFPVDLMVGNWGNDASIRQSVEVGLSVPEDHWVYFCEDDYLHQTFAFDRMDDLIQNRRKYLEYVPRPFYMRLLAKSFQEVPLVIHPPDYPDRYRAKKLRMSFIFLSEHCHWRQVTNSTFTLLLRGSTLQRYKRHFFHCAHGANDRRLSRKLYAHFLFRRKALCLSPIPGLSSHMHEPVLTPMVDWQPVYQDNLKKLRMMAI